ncbi:MAG: hypothetical protein CL920_07915 [Deltaproteobacteria bacterium]|nr:hypothetical protein [Deltaproteobacteria bacterium]MBU48605.1 hypothetical protein [Deltaproteobacteria bacterium]|tara:strand:+ start:276 stop:698 length:423 start_codon:yes stop_codon:yes gene_type:complete
MSADISNEPCPCGGGLFTRCCQPILREHSKAQTAEQLMRARYTSFCKQDLDFLLKSYLTTKPKETIITNFNKMFRERSWVRLEIQECVDGLASDQTGIVQFLAVYTTHDDPETEQWAHERSSFTKEEDGCWYFRSSERPT